MILFVLALFAYQATPSSAFDAMQQAEALSCSVLDDQCLGSEFALREIADQASRRSSSAELGCADTDRACLSAGWDRVDGANLARLQAIVTSRGWPPLTGAAARGAWLIAQHADPSPGTAERAFRDLVIPMVWAEVSEGRLEPDDYARMIDRNALADGGHQPYGSNQPCRNGRFDRESIDSVEQVDQRRKDIGMDIMLSELLQVYDRACERDVQSRLAAGATG